MQFFYGDRLQVIEFITSVDGSHCKCGHTLQMLYQRVLGRIGKKMQVTTALVSSTVGADQQGSVIALSHATRSGVGLVGPALGGVLLKRVGYESVY